MRTYIIYILFSRFLYIETCCRDSVKFNINQYQLNIITPFNMNKYIRLYARLTRFSCMIKQCFIFSIQFFMILTYSSSYFLMSCVFKREVNLDHSFGRHITTVNFRMIFIFRKNTCYTHRRFYNIITGKSPI